jgi:glutamate racemase
VGIFDSGVGGFTVARAILNRRPDLNLVYFGDNLNMPYGGRSLEQLASFARNSIRFLIDNGANILAVGCNASNSALGQGDLKSFGIPTYDLVSSTTEWLSRITSKPDHIGFVATEAAVNSGYWERKIQEILPEISVTAVAAPDFVPLVEAHLPDEPRRRRSVREVLGPLVDAGIRTILHGCTHYPLLEPVMRELYPELEFINPAECLAEKLVAHVSSPLVNAPRGKLKIFSSLLGETFYRVGENALGQDIRPFASMYIVNPYEDS